VTLKPFGEPLERAVRFSARRLFRDGAQPALTLIVVEGGSEKGGKDGL
jgi:hypothetical protein